MESDITFENALRDTAFASYQEEILRLDGDDFVETASCVVRGKNMKKLSDMILAFPRQAKDALYGRYCFDMENHAITLFYGVEHVNGIIRYYTFLMRDSLGITNNKQIAEKTLRRACNQALKKDIAASVQAEESGGKNTGRRIQPVVRPFIAVAAALIISFTGAFAASAELREWVIHWFITDYGEYSLFTAESKQDITSENISSFQPTYIPSGYILDSVIDSFEGLDWVYIPIDGNPDKLIISITRPRAYNYIDTEDMEIEMVKYEDQVLLFYKGDWHNNLVGAIDGYSVYIIGAIDKDEMIQIFEGIKERSF